MKLRTHGLFVFISMSLLLACGEKKATGNVTNLEVVTENVTESIERGKYLVNVLGCTDCHTPKRMTEKGPVPDMERFLMGFDSSGSLPPIPGNLPIGPWVLFSGDLTAAVGPWGISYAGNITPHETGIGTWSLEQFKVAIQEGKYKGQDNSRSLMPPMPVEAYKNLRDGDVAAIFSYLQSIKPIENVVPGYQPPSP